MSLEVNAQAVIDQLLAQNQQLVAEVAALRAYLGMPASEDDAEGSPDEQ